MSGVTERVISSNEGTTEEGLLIAFSLYVCVSVFFSTGEKIVLIKYSDYRNIRNFFFCHPNCKFKSLEDKRA